MPPPLLIHLLLSFLLSALFSLPQTIMKDKWMNIGYEDDDLKPFIEPTQDNNDSVRIGNGPLPPRLKSVLLPWASILFSS